MPRSASALLQGRLSGATVLTAPRSVGSGRARQGGFGTSMQPLNKTVFCLLAESEPAIQGCQRLCN